MKKSNILISSLVLLGVILMPLNLNAQENKSYEEQKLEESRAGGKFDLADDTLEQAFMDAAGYSGALGTMDESELSKVSDFYEYSGTVTTLDGLDYYISNGSLNSVSSFEIDGSSISDISPLKGWTSVTELTIVDSNISDISVLSTMSSLEYINFDNNQISDISSLGKLPNLYNIFLDNNNISDISSLANATGLFYISLENNNISDISALSNTTHLRSLNINNNQVSDISALTNLSNLEEFHGNDNLIEDVSPLANKPSMGLVEIDNNKVYDLSPLSTVRGVMADNQNVEIDLGDFDDIEDIKLLPTEISIFLKDGTEIKMPYGFDINDVVDYKDYSYTITFNQDAGGEKFNGTITVTFSYLAPIPLTPLDPSIPITVPPVTPIDPSDPSVNVPVDPSNPSTPDKIDVVDNKEEEQTIGKKLIQTGKENFFIIVVVTVVISSILVFKKM